MAWYAPGVLLQAARELVRSQDFLRNLDRRESFGALEVIDFSARPASAESPFWFDFIADTGDSGNATHAVFQATLRPQLAARRPTSRCACRTAGGCSASTGRSKATSTANSSKVLPRCSATARGRASRPATT